eukprot:NODE_3553_length_955_cov_78.273731_g3263_i0.p1 GENE.NODE_3553_length_955_cov_78.273731_g3263_i0~~NODE_3553_length_955_cov_78.273731_g3263_i0.p1  ORF type:complete len:174 (+),score=38.36 NODE_3553_length_955_cov_78.273731_g3263_i0:88-609(+)
MSGYCIAVKYNKDTFHVELPFGSTLGDLREAIARVTYIPPHGQKLCGSGVSGPDSTNLTHATKKVMVIGTPANALPMRGQALDIPPLELIERIVWTVRYNVERVLDAGTPVESREKALGLQEHCTVALLHLDGIETNSDAERSHRRAAVKQIQAIAERADQLVATFGVEPQQA